jgi:hypothetical protein
MHTARMIPLVAVLITLAPPAGAVAAEPAPAGGGATITVVAEGLDTPRGLAYDWERRRVLVAEAGAGGPSATNGGLCSPTSGLCYGATGAVFQYSEGSRSGRRIVEGLPSLGFYDETGSHRLGVLGLHDLGLGRAGQIYGAFGLTGTPVSRADFGAAGAAFGQIGRIGTRADELTLVADLAAYEERNNPHPFVVESNPYGLACTGHGCVVADAGGNDAMLMRPDGSLELLAVLPTRASRTNPEQTIEGVPTTVAKGPDGAYYIGELTGWPYYKGEARVWRVAPGHEPRVHADGFTNIVDLTFDERGRLVVLEMAKEGLFAGNPGHNGDTVTGRLVRVERDGSRTDLATAGLENPGGVAYAGNGTYYVTNRATGVGDTGQLLRLRLRR